MNPAHYSYSNTAKHGDDQLVVFTDNNNRLLVSIVCDGVSSSSCGHIAASFICYYIRQYFKETFTINTANEHLKEFATTAIQFAANKLAAFSDRISLQSTTDTVGQASPPLTESLPPEVSNDTGPTSPERSAPVVLYENMETPASPDNPAWDEYKMICEELEYKRYSINKEKVTQLLNTKKEISFECTLSLNMLYQTAPGWWEVLSVNYGDSEFYVVTWDKPLNKITAFLPHYKLTQEALRSYIFSKNGGIEGNPVILTRNINTNDAILLATDGAYIHYTTRGGFPYEPFKKRFADLKTAMQPLKTLPFTWFQYLSGNDAINDDFSLVIIEFPEQADKLPAGIQDPEGEEA